MEKKRGVGFNMSWHAIPNAFSKAIKTSKISVYAQVVFHHICAKKDNDLKCGSSAVEIAEDCNIGQTSARSAIKELRELGWITIKPRLNGFGSKVGNWYYINEIPPGTVLMHSEDPETVNKLQELAELSKDASHDKLDAAIRVLKPATTPSTTHPEPEAVTTPAMVPAPVLVPAEDTPHEDKSKVIHVPKPAPASAPITAKDNEFKNYGKYKRVKLTDAQYSELINQHGRAKTVDYIEQMDSYLEAIGDKYKNKYDNYAVALERWIVRDDKPEKKEKDAAKQKRNGFANFDGRERDHEEIARMELEHLIERAEGPDSEFLREIRETHQRQRLGLSPSDTLADETPSDNTPLTDMPEEDKKL